MVVSGTKVFVPGSSWQVGSMKKAENSGSECAMWGRDLTLELPHGIRQFALEPYVNL